MSDNQRLELTVCGEHFRLKTVATEAARLRQAAALVDERIAALRQSGGAQANLRLALLAALDLAHDLLRDRESAGARTDRRREEKESIGKRIDGLIQMVDQAMKK